MRKLLYLVIFFSQLWVVCHAHSAAPIEDISHFSSHITVNPNGSLDVTESITVNADQVKIRHGITRQLPIHYMDRSGIIHNTTYQITNVLLNNQKVAFQTEAHDNHFFIKLGDQDAILASGTYQFTLQYRLKDVLNLLPGQDELYWNLTGEGWDLPIQKAETLIQFPNATQIAKYEVFNRQGRVQPTSFAITQPTPNQILVAITQPILPHDSLIIKATWPNGIIVGPTLKEKARTQVQTHPEIYVSMSVALILLATLGICILLVRSSRRKIEKLKEKAY